MKNQAYPISSVLNQNPITINKQKYDNFNSSTDDIDNSHTIAQQEALHLRFDFRNLLQRIQKIVVFLGVSCKKNTILQEYIKAAHRKTLNMQIYYKKPWNTMCIMFKRFVKIHPQLQSVLNDLNLSSIPKLFRENLKHFKFFTTNKISY